MTPESFAVEGVCTRIGDHRPKELGAFLVSHFFGIGRVWALVFNDEHRHSPVITELNESRRPFAKSLEGLPGGLS